MRLPCFMQSGGCPVVTGQWALYKKTNVTL